MKQILQKKVNYPELLLSIQRTERKITDVRCQLDSNAEIESRLQATISIIQKFSETIKSLHFAYPIEISDFLDILSLVTNVEYLHLSAVGSFNNQSPINNPSLIVQGEDNELKLHQLRILKVFCCGKDFSSVFSRLPAEVLTELEFSGGLDTLNVLFKRQRNIKSLKLYADDYTDEELPADSLNNLKLESFDWENHKNFQNTATILSTQTKLKYLRLTYIDDNIMNVITDRLSDLEKLDIDVTSITAAPMVRIQNLRKLKDLRLKTSNLTTIDAFTQLDNSRLTTLHIRCAQYIPVELINALAKSVPNLKALQLGKVKNHDSLNATRKSFNFAEVLEIIYDEIGLMCCRCSQTGYFNPKLIEFTFEFDGITCDENFMEKLIVDYPNLKKLVLRSNGRRRFANELTASMLNKIMDGFPKMESVELCFGSSKLTLNDLNFLEEYKNKLKFLSLRANGITKTYGRR